MSLFDFRDLPGADRRGYRLQRLELLNWGTFDKVVWALDLQGATTLVTGQIGSGKSTLVDALSTLLLPPRRIAYNKAAGSESRERSLRSYVLGFHRSERLDDASTRPVGLRDSSSYSVLLATFANEALGEHVTIAQVYWMRPGGDGQPNRFYVCAQRQLSIAQDFADFGSDVLALKRRLRQADIDVFDDFKAYFEKMRRLLGIPGPQAMELFHQTVSLKSVGDLNQFVRDHMLEAFDVESRIDEMVRHFGDLTRAHEAVVRARHQLELLGPVLTALTNHDKHAGAKAQVRALRDALPFFLARRTLELLEAQIAELKTEITMAEAERDEVTATTETLRSRRETLRDERSGAGGNRLTEIERAMVSLTTLRDDAMRRHGELAELLAALDLTPIETASDLAARLGELAALVERLDADMAEQETQALTLMAARIEAQRDATELENELTSLRGRTSAIPARQLALRRRLCDAISTAEDELPFAGELLQVRAGSGEWEGAAERVLHGFALSLLVPEDRYRDVSEWVDREHLAGRLVYFRVPKQVYRREEPSTDPGAEQLRDHLEIKETSFARWLDAELDRRADHTCARTMTEFRSARKAVTRQGQVKAQGGRHEKDDRHRIDDRSQFVLGWSNERKIAALTAQLDQLRATLAGHERALAALKRGEDAARSRRDKALAAGRFEDFRDIDWRTPAEEISQLAEEKRQIEGASGRLRDITQELERVDEAIRTAEAAGRTIDVRLGSLGTRLEQAGTERDKASAVASSADEASHTAHYAALDREIAPAPTDLSAWRDAGARLGEELAKREDRANERIQDWSLRAIRAMRDFRQNYPNDVADWDDSIAAGSEYRALSARLESDDLPRFEQEFKAYLNTNTVREIAGFQSLLLKQQSEIRGRIDRINDSLESIAYNEGRYIRLECFQAGNRQVQEFAADLRACTEASLEGQESYDEERFLRVKQIIDRLAGREGSAEIDRTWRRLVTDVRNWFTFSASERWRETNEEYETYTSSDGKSGGQKEKLAYTVLAASLAYQFKLDWDEPISRAFSFVVIDEAFGRGDDESTRYALELFEKMGLQLLIVTPMQKIHIIEPYVSAVGFVENPGGNSSRLHSVTISEFQQLRTDHLLQAAGLTHSAE